MKTSIWGITFDSEIDLPGPRADGTVDVSIRYGTVPDTIPEPRSEGAAYQAKPGAFLSRAPGVGSYLVEGGATITVQPAPGADEGAVRLLLLGTPMGALLHQRELVPLHASAIEVDGRAVLFAGASATGKSATAAAFHDLGHRVIADDICAVSADGDGSIRAETGPNELLLWRDNLALSNHDPASLRRARVALEKYRYPVTVAEGPCPVDRIIVLGLHGNPELEVGEFEPFGRVRALLAHTRGSGYLEGLGADASHFATTTGIAGRVSMQFLRRPHGWPTLALVVDAVRRLLATPRVGA